jgi:hypothetical protein
MLIFEPILTTFIASIVFRGGWRSSENWFELKNQINILKYSLPESLKHTVGMESS